MDAYNQILRRRMRDATRRLPRADGTLYRDGTATGVVGGVKYIKSAGGFTLSLAGQTADQPDGEYLTALYPDALPEAREGDELAIGSARYRLLAVRDFGAYQRYRLETIVL